MAMFARVCDKLGIVIRRWQPPAALQAERASSAGTAARNTSSPAILRAIARRVSLVAGGGRLHTEPVTRPALVAG